ncbi:hypothetical protein [Prauserella endophytica]|uniref:DUF3040 domain-containing protein n=1 Tax=Prauserella endophytica TaxID=1592324 RepID=A0ABY2RV24_9PSEU|nr:hypothetical protein [Prauserella endophytica]TKG61565.1 hypothetical protein FCN18_33545 [Prauserella endophytica]
MSTSIDNDVEARPVDEPNPPGLADLEPDEPVEVDAELVVMEFGDARVAAPLLLMLITGLATVVAVLSPVAVVTWIAAGFAAAVGTATARVLRGGVR